MRKVLLLIGLTWITLFGTPTPGIAQTINAWTGAYFTNPDLQGNPAVTRQDPDINFNWGSASPAPGIPAENFSVRWTRWVYFDTPGNWTFVTLTDDGARVFVDDQLVLDAWSEQKPIAHTVAVNLTQAYHLVRMEYFERAGTAQAQLQIFSANFPDWRGEYYNNPTLSGTPIFLRNDFAINFNFGAGGPGGNIPGTKFSARWTRSALFAAGKYRFTLTMDDGARVWVDNQLLIDRWRDQRVTTVNAETTLNEGAHFLKVEYYNGDGTGVATLTWAALSGGSETWRGEYFDNANLSGAAAFARDDPAISFNWGNASPGNGVSGPNWAVRWTSKRTHATGYYSVNAIADDGMRVWVDNQLLIDEWHDQSPTPHNAMVYLAAGQHDWRVEFYNHGGIALAQVQITPGATAPDLPPQGIPLAGDVAIDAKNPSFVKAGTAWQTAPNGYGGEAFLIKNQAFAREQASWARWYAPLPRAGNYEVSAYIPAGIGTTRSARYWIAHAGAFDFRKLNQMLYANQWISLGTYYFAATGDEYVTVSDATYEPLLSATLVVDALKFSPR